MFKFYEKLSCLFSAFLFLFSFEVLTKEKANCRIIYDAGSSGTRLYVYEQQGNNWIEHEGPKGGALADPVREFRGKTWDDASSVVGDILKALDQIKENGPVKRGKPKWIAFDWEQKCNVVSATVYATAGMRLAEQVNKKRSKELWEMVRKGLKSRFPGIPVMARTLSGFEEALYAWLVVREYKDKDNSIGIVEMGGASTQIAFKCDECEDAQTITVDGKKINLYGYSFLGLGGDEAPKTIGLPQMCSYGIGAGNSDWSPSSCAEGLKFTSDEGIRDPYNMGPAVRGTYTKIPIDEAEGTKWILTGAFRFFGNDWNIPKCCGSRGDCFAKETACFRGVYFQKYLRTLGVPTNSERSSGNWPHGAAICLENNCLAESENIPCRWRNDGCLYPIK